MKRLEDTEFWELLMRDIFGPREGGVIIVLDAENARKGVAKTSGAVALARALAYRFGYDLQPEDALIAGPEYVRRYQQHPGKEQPSVLVADELVGGGAGDARRAMSSRNIKIGRAFQLLRKKRVVTITTLPDWSDADNRHQTQAAYRLHALENPIGTFKAYKITTPFGDSGARTKGLGPDENTRRINFPDIASRDDPYFRHLERLKDELLAEDDFSAAAVQGSDEDDGEDLTEDDIRREERVETAIRLYEPWNDSNGQTYPKVAAAIPEYGPDWVGKVMRAWERGEYRSLVEDPTD